MPIPFDVTGDPQNALLVTLCGRDAIEELRPAQVAPLAEPAFRTRFFERAARHSVTGLALATLSRSVYMREPGGPANEDFGERLKHLRRRAAIVELQRDYLITVLQDTAERSVVLKGGALIGSVYTEPVERDLRDLDVLVPEDRLKRVVRALMAAGFDVPQRPGAVWHYRRSHFHIPLHKKGMLRVEVHWAVGRPSSLSWLDPERILEQAVEVERAGRPPLRCPRPEHMILHLVLQNCYEGFSRLSRFVDIDRIVTVNRGLDWETLVNAARESGLTAATALTLHITMCLLGTEFPESVLRELRPRSIARAHIAIMRPLHSLFGEDKRYGSGHLLRLWLHDGRRDRLLYLRRLMGSHADFPRRDEVPGLFDRLWRLVKLLGWQGIIYAHTAMAWLTVSGRTQMRFWSRNASSSDRR